MSNYIEHVSRWASVDVIQSALKYKKLSIFKKVLQDIKKD